MRDIFLLGEAIKHEIPDIYEYQAARAAIDALMKKYRYRAPETWSPDWYKEMAKVLDGYLPPPEKFRWTECVWNIFSDRVKP